MTCYNFVMVITAKKICKHCLLKGVKSLKTKTTSYLKFLTGVLVLGVSLLVGLIYPGVLTVNAASDYSVKYVIDNDWGTGATVNVTIKNNGSAAINGWTLTWTFPGNQKISNLWNASYTQNGTSVTITNLSYNAMIPSNGGEVNFGFGISYSGANEQPLEFILNGNAIATPTPVFTSTPTLTGTPPVPTPTPTLITQNGRQMENIDRGVVAVKVSNGVFISWRILGPEFSGVSYNLYRGSAKVNDTPLTGASNYLDTAGTASSTYSVSPLINGMEQARSNPVTVWGNQYLDLPLQIPSGSYTAGDCSVGDLNGDGKYEIVVKWDPSNQKDNSQSGFTDNVYLDAYTLTGTRMWRIDLGRNIRAGAHYTQFMVYDLDGDGKAEVACKTADGTVDGRGTVIGNSTADYRNSNGYILSGPEYLTVFSGETGAALQTVNYEPARGNVSDWGDSYGNRVDRFLACIAYLDGRRPSLVMCRGYYTRTVLVAWDWRNKTLVRRWTFDSNKGYSNYAGQGNHNLSVADVDNDGRDEIIYGSCTIDDNGAGLYNTGLGHGDAMHVGDFDPDRTGLEVWQCHEGGSGATFRDARTGKVIFRYSSSGDVGRACADDLTSRYRGCEVWAAGSPFYSCKGSNAGSAPAATNHVVWWDGDDLRELLDGTTISKYGGGTLLSAGGCLAINGTKSNPNLQADILGDWREEVIWRTADSRYLRIYTTTAMTARRLFTLMHDPIYRLGIAWQNVAYNQPPHVGFYLGDGMTAPAVPDIYLAP
jgi:rhamnogalacturonan endolyase